MTAPALHLATGATTPSNADARPFVSALLAGSCTCRLSAAACMACKRWVRTYTETQQRRRAWAKHESEAR